MGAPDSEGVPRHSSPVRPSFGSGLGLGPGCGLAASAHAGPRPGPGQGRTHSDCDPSPGTLQNEVLLRLRAQTSFRLGLGLLLASPLQSGSHSPAGSGSGIGQRPTPTQHPPPTVRANVGRLVIGAVRASGPYSFRPTGVIYTRLRPSHWQAGTHAPRLAQRKKARRARRSCDYEHDHASDITPGPKTQVACVIGAHDRRCPLTTCARAGGG